MSPRADERAVAPVVGAILIFAILIVALSTYQAVAVPNQNEDVEFEHSTAVQGDLQQVRAAILAAGGGDATQSASVSLGPTYPNRIVAINPPPPEGELATTREDPLTVTVENAHALDEDARAYWDGSPRAFETRQIAYRPGYNEYREAPNTMFEHGILFDVFDSGATIPKNDISFLSGRSVSFAFVEGTYRETGTNTVSLDALPRSASDTRVAIEDDGEPIRLRLETRRSEEAWNEIVEDTERVTAVEFTEGDPNEVVLELDDSVSYRLRLGMVSVDESGSTPDATYLVRTAGDGATVPTDTPVRLEATVRDRFNNPREDVTVDASIAAGSGSLDATSVTSDDDGRVTVTFTPDDGATHEIDLAFADATGAAYETVTFTVEAFTVGTGDDPVNPPQVSLDDGGIPNQVEQGETIGLAGTVTSVGSETTLRSGTAMTEVRYVVVGPDGTEHQSGTIFEEDPWNTRETIDLTNADDIDTSGWEEGEHEITVRGQDASGRLSDDTAADAVTVEITAPEGPFFEVTIDDVEDTVTAGDTVTVDYTVENTGGDIDTQDIEFRVNGSLEDTTADVELDAGETFDGTFTYTTTGSDVPEMAVEVASDDDADTATVTVDPAPAPVFDVTIDDTNSPVTEGETLEVTATIENTGDASGTQDVVLELDGGVGTVDTQEVTLASGASEPITLEWDTQRGDADTYEATVRSDDDSDTAQIDVDERTMLYPTGVTENQGSITDFDNMQAADGAFATMEGGPGNQAFDIEVETDPVPSGEYDLELGIDDVNLQGGSAGIDVTVIDIDGNEIGSTVLEEGDAGQTVDVTVDPIPTEQAIVVRYQGNHQNDGLDIDFQRFVERV